jgi:predicted enzyme related to lactoylglutathione lyase
MSQRDPLEDPLNVLRAEDRPVQPDPAFAARLRRRLESALTLPNRTEGVVMSDTDTEISALNEPSADEPIQHGDIGYVSVWVPDAGRAAAFYQHVLGWSYAPAAHQVTNTELPVGIVAASGHPTLFCCYAVTDVQAARRSIAEAGGTPGEVRRTDYGTILDATDPQGVAFAVYEPPGGQKRLALNGSGPGELSYVTYRVPDSAVFRDFYARILHWTFAPGRVDDGWQVQSTHPMAGVAGGSARPTTVPMWTVADIAAAAARVREAGGTVLTQPARQPYGVTAECSDDQGAHFHLGEF